jgi:hypothetical protein
VCENNPREHAPLADRPLPDNRAALAELGRRLASQRDDLIARGVNPNLLLVPLHPDEPRR